MLSTQQPDLSRPVVMGILNITPDSFSDGGRFFSVGRAVEAGLSMVDAGAQVLDLGGESTRPGAEPVSLDEELDRVMPVLEKLRAETSVALSVDTSKPDVMRAAIKAGADVINDVNALEAEGAISSVANSNVSLCLMHKRGNPSTMQANPQYEDVVQEVFNYLQERIQACVDQGIALERIWIDPGFGFGKTLKHNLQLMNRLAEFKKLELPILIGVSRKSMIGAILDCEIDQRMVGGLALAAWSVLHGGAIIRTHDVKPTVEVLKVLEAVSAHARA